MPGYVYLAAGVYAFGGGLLADQDDRRRLRRARHGGGVRDRARDLRPRRRVPGGPPVRALAGGDRRLQRDRHRHAGGGAAGAGGLAAGAQRRAAAAGGAGGVRAGDGARLLRARGRAAAGAAGGVSLSRARRQLAARRHPHPRRGGRRLPGAAPLGAAQPPPLRRAVLHRQPRRPHGAGRREPQLATGATAGRSIGCSPRGPATRSSRRRTGSRIASPTRWPSSGPPSRRATRSACWSPRPIACWGPSARCSTGRSIARACCRPGAGSTSTGPASSGWSTTATI